MDEIIRCTLVGVGSVAHGDVQTNPTGRQTWVGVRVRTSDGKIRFFQSMLVEAEACIILQAALEGGEDVELWLTGKVERAYPYAIRTAAEEWYSDAYRASLVGHAKRVLLLSVITLPLLGIGIFLLPLVVSCFTAASTFAARHPRATFALGYEVGVLGRRPETSPKTTLEAA